MNLFTTFEGQKVLTGNYLIVMMNLYAYWMIVQAGNADSVALVSKARILYGILRGKNGQNS